MECCRVCYAQWLWLPGAAKPTCERCLELLALMTDMQQPRWWKRQQNDELLRRVLAHPQYQRLDLGTRLSLQRLAQLDRRDAQQDAFVSRAWTWLCAQEQQRVDNLVQAIVVQ